jgi:hypothetical protein
MISVKILLVLINLVIERMHKYMIKNTVSQDEVISLLNDALNRDHKAIEKLFKNQKVLCNKTLAEHPTIQIGLRNNITTVSILGIINGFFGIDDKNGFGAIVAIYEDEKLIKFQKAVPKSIIWTGI